ncbi:MAG: hypothetical protein V4606_02065 [Patescibacteria group bacterium]
MVPEFNEILKIVGNPPSQRAVFEKRMNRINEAMSWDSGTFRSKIYHSIWENGVYKIAFGKPGKESTNESGYTGALNPHDMRPDLFKNNINLGSAATFGDVVSDLEEVAKVEKYCVELIGALLFRSAFLLDHKDELTISGTRIYRYCPNSMVIDYITSKIPLIYGVPPIVFLQYLDAIALNEDVKYYYKGKDLTKGGVGGKNNYLTYVMIIAVITGELPISLIAKKLLRTNVAAISIQDGLRVLPHIK